MKSRTLARLLLITLLWQNPAVSANPEIGLPPIQRVTLEECIVYAIDHAESVLASRERAVSETERHAMIKREYLPQAYADLDAGTSFEGDARVASSADMAVPVYWGALHADRRLAKNDMERSRATYQFKINEAVLAVKDAYYRSLFAQRQIMAIQDSVTQLEEHLQVTANQYRAGNMLRLNVVKVETALIKERIRFEKALGEQRYYDSFLNNLLDRELDAPLILDEEKFIPLALSMKDAYQISEDSNPFFKIVTANVKESKLETQKAKSRFFLERMDVFGRYLRQQAPYVRDEDENEFIVGVRGRINIWDWDKRLKILRQKKAQQRAAAFEAQGEIEKHNIQVKRLYEDLTIAENGTLADERIVKTAEDEYYAQKARFYAGKIKTDELLKTHSFLSKARLEYERSLLARQIAKARLQSFIGVPDTSALEGRNLKLGDEELLLLIAKKAFDFFDNEYNKHTGLINDAAGGGNASIGVAGFGFAALVVGCERGWIAKDEAERRIARGLKTLLYLQESSKTREGIFFHFLDPLTGERVSKSEISIIDTALMLVGAFTASEYFGGEVKALTEKIYRNVKWESFLAEEEEHKNEMYIGWLPESGFMKYYWNAYSDETLIIILMALGSPVSNLPPELYRGFRREKAKYGEHEFYPSWSGGLFAYQYGNMFYDFKTYIDPDGIGWNENTVSAIRSQIDYLRNAPTDSKTLKEGFWGISAGELSNGHYDMLLGVQPNLMGSDRFGGISVPSAIIGSVEYVPDEALKLIRKLYEEYPNLWGKYGFTSSFDLDKKFFSAKFYGLELGLALISIDNHLGGTVRKHFMQSPYVKAGLKKAGFTAKA